MKNNFDQSSTGLNIELSFFKDIDQSARDFEESFNIIQQDSYRSHTIAEYTDFGNIRSEFSFTNLSEYDFTVKGCKEALLKINPVSELNDTAKKIAGKTFKALNKTEIAEFLNDYFYYSSDLSAWLQNNFTPLFTKLVTRGNCQGDYAEVIFSHKFKEYWKKETKKDFSVDSFSDLVDNLFWNAPIYGRLVINDKEYYLDELLSDRYDYDKDQLVADFVKTYCSDFSSDNLQIIVDFLNDNLPEYPEYQ